MNLLETYISKAHDRYYLHRYVYPFIKRNNKRNIHPDNTITIFSFPRSGSTWLTELLLTIPNSCLFDEPFLRNFINSPNKLPDYDVRKFNEVAELDFYFFQPIPTHANDKELFAMMNKLLKGEALSIGLYNDYGLHRLKKSEVYLVKFNYGMLLSSWLLQNFNTSAIFLVRNPFACIASILRHDLSSSLTIPDQCIIPDFKYNEVFLQYQEIYKTIKSPEEYFAFLWCLSFKEGPEKNKDRPQLIIFYEDLLVNYAQQIHRIFNYLNKPVPPEIFEIQLKPSSSTYSHSLQSILDQNQIEAWKKHLTNSQRNNISRMLESFNITIYKDGILPDKAYFSD